MRAALRWLVEEWQWPYAGALAAGMLVFLFPVLRSTDGVALALISLQLPVYLIHQLEEHAGDRFRRYINEGIGGGRELLTRPVTFWVNALCVWALDLAVLLLAVYVDLALGLIAVYITAVNALTHIASGAAARRYTPGLVTAIVLFVPVSVWGAYEVITAADPGRGFQALAIGVAVGLHAALIALVVSRLVRLRRTTSVPA